MQSIIEWAAKWAIRREALDDLLKTDYVPATDSVASSESRVASEVLLESARRGWILWRNNVGALKDDRGVPVRYGLCNDSKALNAKFKSGDLIGIRPIVVTANMVGYTIGQFVSIETKAANWKWHGNAHETAQLDWSRLVLKYGGHAQIINSAAQL